MALPKMTTGHTKLEAKPSVKLPELVGDGTLMDNGTHVSTQVFGIRQKSSFSAQVGSLRLRKKLGPTESSPKI